MLIIYWWRAKLLPKVPKRIKLYFSCPELCRLVFLSWRHILQFWLVARSSGGSSTHKQQKPGCRRCWRRQRRPYRIRGFQRSPFLQTCSPKVLLAPSALTPKTEMTSKDFVSAQPCVQSLKTKIPLNIRSGMCALFCENCFNKLTIKADSSHADTAV